VFPDQITSKLDFLKYKHRLRHVENHPVCVLNRNDNTTTVVKHRSARRILFNSTIILFYTSYNIIIIIITVITITVIIYDDDRTSFEILLLCRRRTTISRSVQYYTNGRSIIIIAEQCGEAFASLLYTAYITHNILYNNIITAVV